MNGGDDILSLPPPYITTHKTTCAIALRGTGFSDSGSIQGSTCSSFFTAETGGLKDASVEELISVGLEDKTTEC